jgi:hypothetical protein
MSVQATAVFVVLGLTQFVETILVHMSASVKRVFWNKVGFALVIHSI